VKLLVAQGDTVEAGQPVLIVEAMKMENEVKAGRAGVVLKFNVAEGDSVEADAVLAEIGDA
jgi:biotin carboxyl carrier protein